VFSVVTRIFGRHRTPGRPAALMAAALLVAATVGDLAPHALAADLLSSRTRSIALPPVTLDLTTRPVVVGSAVRSDGGPLTAGRVLVYALPRQEVIDAARGPGAGFDLTLVSRADIDSKGVFVAGLAPAVDLRRYASSGVVNFQLWVVNGDEVGHAGFTRTIATDGSLLPERAEDAVVATVPSGDEPSATTIHSAPASPTAGIYRGAPVVDVVTVRAPTSARPEALEGEGQIGWDCEHRGQLNGRRVTLGQIYQYRRGVRSRFNYLVGARSSLGYGIRIGNALTFHEGGTITRVATTKTSWRWRAGRSKVVYATLYDYGFYYCRAPWPPFDRIIWEILPNGYRAGAIAWSTSHRPFAGNCTGRFERDSEFTVDREKNIQWSDGVSMSDVIGIDFSSRSGYSTEVKLQFHFKLGGRRVCGTKAVPTLEPPGFVVVR
jgi:hypothetical protein